MGQKKVGRRQAFSYPFQFQTLIQFADTINMKKKYLLLVLFVSVIIPFQLQAQAAEVFRQEGIASWYGREFEGRPTASGEIFDSSQLTAAHPNLPFGTMLVVTNIHNNKSVTVRVNDRGPFVPARIIDVSRAAAEQLDMIVTGTAPVRIETIERIAISTPAVGAQMSPQAAPQVTETPSVVIAAPVSTVIDQTAVIEQQVIVPERIQPDNTPVFVTQPPVVSQPGVVQSHQVRLSPSINISADKNYRFQVGSFKVARNAVEAFERLKNAGLNPAYERFTDSNGEYFRVVVAGISGADVQITTERIGAAGFREAIIREEN